MNGKNNLSLAEAVNLFAHGAKTLSAGSYLNNNSMCKKGLAIIGQATQVLDAQCGRDPLLRLLDEPDDFVRTVAAAGLWQSHTELARKVIEQVKRKGGTEASMLALKILMFHGRYNPVSSDPRYYGLHEDETGPDNWFDPAFRERAISGQLPATFARKPNTSPEKRRSL